MEVLTSVSMAQLNVTYTELKKMPISDRKYLHDTAEAILEAPQNFNPLYSLIYNFLTK